ncbi:DUF4358 domain-containing protein [Paenibacillus sp. NPDC058174]|uniref:DUF4358 domain-containing protein n=1 Tax=Paenibacillus sp. NPDC058174 TaxID=3346366 RepID=UPI0036D9E3D6
MNKLNKKFGLATLIIALGIMLSACSGASNTSDPGKTNNSNNSSNVTQENNSSAKAPVKSTKEMVDSVLAAHEQPKLLELESAMVKDMYHFDPALLEESTIMTPMMNVKTNEIAVLKVKDSKDVAAVEEGVKKRAEDVQKTFETYLPDQYENAKNYKLVTKGNYVIFIISESADELEQAFEAYFK